MSTLRLLLIGLIVALFLGAEAFIPEKPTVDVYPPTPNLSGAATVRIGSSTIQVKLAMTPESQAKGLGGVSTIAPDEGMLFVFTPAYHDSFWNKEMRIPFDLLWIADGNVIGLEENVREEAAGIRYLDAPAPVDYVLEVQGGWALRHGVKKGDSVSIF